MCNFVTAALSKQPFNKKRKSLGVKKFADHSTLNMLNNDFVEGYFCVCVRACTDLLMCLSAITSSPSTLYLLLLLFAHRPTSDPWWWFPAERTMIAPTALCGLLPGRTGSHLQSDCSVCLPLTPLSLRTASICTFIAKMSASPLSDKELLRSWNADFWQDRHIRHI